MRCFVASVCLLTACVWATAKDPVHEPLDPAGFVKMAAHGGLFEVESSRLAEKVSSSEHVKEFAAHMIKDHTKANAELKALATKKGLHVPAELDKKHADMLAKLHDHKGKAFDAAYVHEQVAAHKEAVALFKAQANHGEDPALKAWAKTTLPALEMHLEHAEKLAHDHAK